MVKLTSVLISFPKLDECIQNAGAFQKMCHIPNVIGAIDGTHIPVKAPKIGYMDFVNRKGWESMVMKAVVDNNYLFRDVSMKLPGSVHDATVFKESGIFKNHSRIISEFVKLMGNKKIPFIILRDPAYPLLPWLLKPYTGYLTGRVVQLLP
nr:protein ALP1-like [Drosophila suzukii]XP_036677809.1 protein ALP1-like [Drosophila suzukii]XP_036677810.1 protein ALP1-like [Drosophila suzukii]